MKKIYLVFVTQQGGKFHATAETIKTGNNLIPFIDRYNAVICHVCESATQAAFLAVEWNRSYKENGTNLY